MRTSFTLIGVLLLQILLSPAAVAQTTKPVQTAAVEKASISQEWTFSATVQARAEVNIAPEVPGRIVEVLVDQGDAVERGDILAKLNTTKLALAVRQAEAMVASATANYEHTSETAKELVMVQLTVAEAGVAAAGTAVSQVKDLAYVQTTSQKEQAEAGLAALQATLRKIKEGARDQEVKQVEAVVEQAKAGVENARANLERVRQLHAKDAASNQTLEGVETQHRVAEAQYEAAQQQLALVKEGARAEDIEAMEAQLRQAEAGMQLVDKLNSTKSWEKDIALAEAQLQQAQAGLKSAQIQVGSEVWQLQIAVAKSQMDQAQVGLELAKEQLADATVRAPVTGVISSRVAEVGNMAAPGVALFDLVDLSERRASIEVSESDLSRVKVGMPAQVRLANGTQPIAGRVDRISPTVDPATRMGTVRVVLDTADTNVRPGMYAEIVIQPASKSDALVIPRSAVLGLSNGQPYVYGVENEHAVRRDIELGVSSGERVEVASGLNQGDAVIISGQYSLSDGAAVHVVNP